MSAPGYDMIGDIHGHASELVALLETLGYRQIGGIFRHTGGRKVVFLGDFIDRGPEIRQTLLIARRMVEAGEAHAILGNHEVNALRYATLGSDGKYLRPHHSNNRLQHQATLDQFPDPSEWAEWLYWFAGLPLSLEIAGMRAVHACWDSEVIEELDAIGRLEGATLERYSKKGTATYDRISRILNGPEARMPEGHLQLTADGSMRRDIRVKWWIDLRGLTCREMVFPHSDKIPNLMPEDFPETGYPMDAPPTFFGHYALKETTPFPIRSNLACLDYGIGKGGFLCAYCWDGEDEIQSSKFYRM